jgi:hypothetical protein
MLLAPRGGDMIGKTAQSLAKRHDPQACALAAPVQ